MKISKSPEGLIKMLETETFSEKDCLDLLEKILLLPVTKDIAHHLSRVALNTGRLEVFKKIRKTHEFYLPTTAIGRSLGYLYKRQDFSSLFVHLLEIARKETEKAPHVATHFVTIFCSLSQNTTNQNFSTLLKIFPSVMRYAENENLFAMAEFLRSYNRLSETDQLSLVIKPAQLFKFPDFIIDEVFIHASSFYQSEIIKTGEKQEKLTPFLKVTAQKNKIKSVIASPIISSPSKKI